VTESHVGYSGKQIAHAVSLDTNHANAFVAAGVEKCWPRFDHCGGEMHDVFIVISEGGDGRLIARTVYAASEDNARQTHRENYAHPASLDAIQADGFVAAGVEKCWPRFDHDVFVVISEGGDGRLIARTVYAASEDDVRQTHRENYADEPIVAVHQ
jgi:NADPH-dependent curcumin reductase CurA